MSIKLIAFDLDDTLWDNNLVILKAEDATQEFLELVLPEFAKQVGIEARKNFRIQYMKKNSAVAAQITLLRHTCLQQQLLDFGLEPQKAAEISGKSIEIFVRERQKVSPFPKVASTLELLQRRYILSAITNGNADIFSSPLAKYFSHAVRAEELGVSKPDSKIFEYGLAQAKVEPHQAVYVGDHPVKDIQAANNSGMNTIWVNYDQKKWPKDLQSPDHTIHCFSELLETINKIDLRKL